jgi:hypothetical protein
MENGNAELENLRFGIVFLFLPKFPKLSNEIGIKKYLINPLGVIRI